MNSTLSGNTARDGGAVDNVGTLALTICTVTGNSASETEGGIWDLGTMTLTSCRVSRNAVLK